MKCTRILVATLASGEAEFEAGRAAVAGQLGVDLEHAIFEGLPELEAHRALFELWNRRRSEFDLLVKVDGDTVLNRTTALADIADLFRRRPDVTAAQIALHDYFTDGPLAGLNAFSSRVWFEGVDDPLFCDRVEERGHATTLGVEETAPLAPIAWHCTAPHFDQAFHFGYRRMLKGQGDIVGRTLAAWRVSGGEGRLAALAGMRAAYLHPLAATSYADAAFARACARARALVRRGASSAFSIEADVQAILDRRPGIRARRLLLNAWRRAAAASPAVMRASPPRTRS